MKCLRLSSLLLYSNNRKCNVKCIRNISSSINEEVEKFSKVGKDWWNKNSNQGTGPLHAMNPTRGISFEYSFEFIRRCIAWELGRKQYPALEQIRGVKILDVGCGGGLLSESLSRLGANVTAIDPSKRNIEIAKDHSSLDPLTRTINYKNMSIEDMAMSGEKFDAICSLEVIEHVDEPLNFIRSCSTCLEEKSSGLFLSTINRNTKSYAMAILGAEHILRMVPVGTHDWNKFIKPEELTIILENANMMVKKIQGLRFNGIPGKTMTWSLDDNDIDVNYILHAVRTTK